MDLDLSREELDFMSAIRKTSICHGATARCKRPSLQHSRCIALFSPRLSALPLAGFSTSGAISVWRASRVAEADIRLFSAPADADAVGACSDPAGW